LLGWMHRKFRENNNETLKDLSIASRRAALTGKLSTDDRQYYPRDVSIGKYLGRAQRDTHFSRPFTRLDAVVEAEEDFEETPTELFHGFLAIGTLGTESTTPTFSISIENIDEKETQVEEDEPELNNDEPVKIISNEAENEIFSGKATHASTGRVNQCSDISLGGQPAVSAEAYGTETGGLVCPEQNCRRSVSVTEQTGGPLSMRQKHRTSLEELLRKTKQTEENCEVGEKQTTGKRVDNSAVHLMKKFLK
ncbi:hypothetical protein M569_01914, partial [Genlisea aurea]